jgi:hypothetical protein
MAHGRCGQIRLGLAPWTLAAVLVGWGPAFQGPAAAARATQPSAASSSRESRDEAVRSLAQAKLGREARAKISGILGATTIYRRLPSQLIECDPNLYVFLVEHPDLVVNIWEALGISEVSVERTGENAFLANDKAGTLGRMEYLHRSPEMHLVYAEGSYEGPLFGRPIKGKSLLILQARYFRNSDGRHYVRCRMDAFLQVENVGVGMLAKTLQPLVGAAADHNFRETAAFLSSVSRAAEINYPGMQRMAENLTRVAEDEREEFASLTEQLAIRAAMAQTAHVEKNAAIAARQGAADRPAASTARRGVSAPRKR